MKKIKIIIIAIIASLTIQQNIANSTPVKATGTIETAFSKPQDNQKSSKTLVLETIDDAESSIYMAAYYLSEKDLIQSLLKAKKRGVSIKVILDRSQKNLEIPLILTSAEIECKIDTKNSIMHHKFIIVDNDIGVNGSFNYTMNASFKNAENTTKFTGSKYVVDSFSSEWKRLFLSGENCAKSIQ